MQDHVFIFLFLCEIIFFHPVKFFSHVFQLSLQCCRWYTFGSWGEFRIGLFVVILLVTGEVGTGLDIWRFVMRCEMAVKSVFGWVGGWTVEVGIVFILEDWVGGSVLSEDVVLVFKLIQEFHLALFDVHEAFSDFSWVIRRFEADHWVCLLAKNKYCINRV